MVMKDIGIKLGVLTLGVGINHGLMKVMGLGIPRMDLHGLGMRLKKDIGLLIFQHNLNNSKLKQHLHMDLQLVLPLLRLNQFKHLESQLPADLLQSDKIF